VITEKYNVMLVSVLIHHIGIFSLANPDTIVYQCKAKLSYSDKRMKRVA